MDAYEATKVVFSRIQSLDAENASKIMGILLIKEHSEKEMIRLAFGPESLLISLVLKAKQDLSTINNNNNNNGFQIPTPLTIPSFNNSEFVGVSSTACSSTLNPSTPPFYSRRRSFSVSDVNFGGGGVGSPVVVEDSSLGLGGWKPCMYYAKGFCKNGSTCRFVHGGGCSGGGGEEGGGVVEQCHQLIRSNSMQHYNNNNHNKLLAVNNNSNFSLFSPFHQNDSPRAAAAALMMEEELNKLSRSPRGLDNSRADSNHALRQIYLTFPADSTFREEDVSNYFSIYGPVQDVRIPYQQKRMFGFVTFVYPETVKIILAKGNPHFVCDARVLVKPYKEKGKVPDKFRKHQQMDRGEFSSCGSPTGVDSRDLFDPPIGGRMYDTQTQYMLWRRKLEEEADFQKALEFQTRRMMGLQLLDGKRNQNHHRSLSTGAPSIHLPPIQSPNSIFHQSLLGSDRSSPDASEEICVSPPVSETNQALEEAINEVIDREKEASIGDCSKESRFRQDNVFDFPESLLEHNLPDSPFASPKKAADVFAINGNNNSKVSPFLPSSPSLEMPPFNSCYFQMPRISPGHGAIGM